MSSSGLVKDEICRGQGCKEIIYKDRKSITKANRGTGPSGQNCHRIVPGYNSARPRDGMIVGICHLCVVVKYNMNI